MGHQIDGHNLLTGVQHQEVQPLRERNSTTDALLHGTFDTTNVDPREEVGLFLKTMAIPESLRGVETIDITITTEDFQTSSFRRLPEIAASSPLGRHLTHYKVLARYIKVAGLFAYMISLPFLLLLRPSAGSMRSKSCWKKTLATLKSIACESFNFSKLT